MFTRIVFHQRLSRHFHAVSFAAIAAFWLSAGAASAQSAGDGTYQRIGQETFNGGGIDHTEKFMKAVGDTLARIKATKFSCIDEAQKAIDWLDWEGYYVGNLLVGAHDQARNDALESALKATLADLRKLHPCGTTELPRSRFGPYPSLASASGPTLFNQVDVVGGFNFASQPSSYVVGGGIETIGPGNGPYGEIAYHRMITNNLVIWGVVSDTSLGRGSPGGFGSTQTANIWDNKMVIGWKDALPCIPGASYEVYGGLKLVAVDQTSRSAAGATHTGSFVGLGPTVGAMFDAPIVPVSSDGTGGLIFNSYLEGSFLFGGLNDTSSYGVNGGNGRTAFYTGEFVGLSTHLAPNITLGAGVMERQYYNVLDRNLTVAGTTAGNNLYTATAVARLTIRY